MWVFSHRQVLWSLIRIWSHFILHLEHRKKCSALGWYVMNTTWTTEWKVCRVCCFRKKKKRKKQRPVCWTTASRSETVVCCSQKCRKRIKYWIALNIQRPVTPENRLAVETVLWRNSVYYSFPSLKWTTLVLQRTVYCWRSNNNCVLHRITSCLSVLM